MGRKPTINKATVEERQIAVAALKEKYRLRREKVLSFDRNPVGFCKTFFPDEIYTSDIQDMMMSVVDNPYTGACSCNSSGKSHSAARIAKWWIDCFSHLGSAQVYLVASPSEKTGIIWSELQNLQIKYPHLFPTRVMAREYYVNPDPFSDEEGKWFAKRVSLPDAGSDEQKKESVAGKHAEYILFILDESNKVAEPIWDAIDECLSGSIMGRVLFFFNPRSKTGAAWDRYSKGLCNRIQISAFNHPNVREGRLVIPGAVDRDFVIRATNEWTRVMNEGEKWDDDTCFTLPDFLVGKTTIAKNGQMYPPLPRGNRVIEKGQYSYSILGRPPKVGASQLIHPDWIATARGRYDKWLHDFGDKPMEGVKPIGGLDVGTEVKNADYSTLVLRWGGFTRFKAWQSLEQPDLEQKVADIARAVGARAINVDGTGVGWGVPAHLRLKGITANKVIFSEKATRIVAQKRGELTIEAHCKIMRDQLLWDLREWLRPENNQEAMLPPNQRLLDSLEKLTYELDDRNRICVVDAETLKLSLGYSPDDLWGLALTFAPDGGGWAMFAERN